MLLSNRPLPAGRRAAGRRLAPALFALLLVLTGGPWTSVRAQTRETSDDQGVTTLTGALDVTNPFILDIITEPYVLLNDLSNFVTRDYEGPLPEFIQETAELEGDLADASYTLTLPIAPQATRNDVDGGGDGDGVYIFSVDLWANIVGDPFVDPIEGGGWSTSFTSLEVAAGTNEITGGMLVVWAPDDEQAFPSGFGPDGLLLTDDDPVAEIPAGWTVVDLDAEPFDLLRDETVEVPILEGDGGLKDLSDLSFTEAFDALVEELRLRYPFTEFKGIDWDALVEEFRPLIEEAEASNDLDAFQVAMMHFAVAMRDGHVGIEPNATYLITQLGGGVGLTLGETDEGQVIVTAVADGSPAAEAGIERGAEVIAWNGDPIGEAIAATPLVFPASSPHTTRQQQIDLLPRGEGGEEVTLAYLDADGDEERVELRMVEDIAGLIEALGGTGFSAEMPVTVEVLPSGLGYVRVNTFYDDLVLMTHAWEWALTRLSDLQVPGLILDVRGNTGGNGGVATYFAGSFYDEEFTLADSFFATTEGEFIRTERQVITPSPVQWDGPVAVLIDQNCLSACEIFTGAMAVDPDHLIVGQTPTAGVEAGIFPWQLPGDLFFQAPLVYFEVDGEVWIEGSGIPPTIDVPITVESLLSAEDVVLQAAEDELT